VRKRGDSEGRDKTFRVRQPDGDGWRWKYPETRLPYRLPDLLVSEEPVLVAEGEKDADTLAALGFTATTNDGGAGKWRADLNPHFTGRDVVILPDNDAAGEDHLRKVGNQLAPVAASVKVARVPEQPDVTAWVEACRAAGEDDATIAERVSALLREAQAFEPSASGAGSDGPSQVTPATASDSRRLFYTSHYGSPDLSHDSLALALSDRAQWCDNARYVRLWGAWLFWDGARWARSARMEEFTHVRAFLRAVADQIIARADERADNVTSDDERKRIRSEALGLSQKLRDRSTVVNVEALARSNVDLAADPDMFDANLDLLGTPGGTVDLRTGILRAASPQDYMTKLVAVTPAAPGTQAPQWERFLTWAMQDDPEMVSFLKRLCGYALTGHVSEQRLPFLYGTGGNGKSVFTETVEGIIADYAARAPATALLDTPHENHPTELAGLRGARFVLASEIPPGKTWKEERLKDLTGGDKIKARYMRQDFFEYDPQFTLVMYGNNQPAFRAIDPAVSRRVLLIPFEAQIDEASKDQRLKEKLRAEWPAILRWMIDGAVEWYRHGLCPPERVRQASEEYLAAEDFFGQFVNEQLVREDGGHIGSARLYNAFRQWSEAHGVRNPWTQKTLAKEFRKRGFDWGQDNQGRKGLKGYQLAQPPESPM
jgi:putative DNA primase/helicase